MNGFPDPPTCSTANHETILAVGEAYLDLDDDCVGWFPYCQECLDDLLREHPIQRLGTPTIVERAGFVALPHLTKSEATLVLNAITHEIERLEELTPHFTDEHRQQLYGEFNSLRTAYAEAILNHPTPEPGDVPGTGMTLQYIIDHQDELAQKFEDFEPTAEQLLGKQGRDGFADVAGTVHGGGKRARRTDRARKTDEP